MTMWTVSPDSVEPDLWTELATMTAMYCGTMSGGPELLPGSLVQPAPHCGGCPVPSAKPLKLAGAEPPRNELLVDVDDRAARVAVHVGWPRDAALSATPATKRQCQVPVGDAADAVLEEASRENDGGAVRDVQRPGVGGRRLFQCDDELGGVAGGEVVGVAGEARRNAVRASHLTRCQKAGDVAESVGGARAIVGAVERNLNQFVGERRAAGGQGCGCRHLVVEVSGRVAVVDDVGGGFVPRDRGRVRGQ